MFSFSAYDLAGQQYKSWVQSCRVGFESIGYPYNITIASVRTSCQVIDYYGFQGSQWGKIVEYFFSL